MACGPNCVPKKGEVELEAYARGIERLLDVVEPIAHGLVELVEAPHSSADAVDRLLDLILRGSGAASLELRLNEHQPIPGAVVVQRVDSSVVTAVGDGAARGCIVDLAPPTRA